MTITLTPAQHAAVTLHHAARPPVDGPGLAQALTAAHQAGLEPALIQTILADARPAITPLELEQATRRPDPPPPTIHEDGPGWPGPWAALCAELRREVDAGQLELCEAIRLAAILTPRWPDGTPADPSLACLIAITHLVVLPGGRPSAPLGMRQLRFQLACATYWDAAA